MCTVLQYTVLLGRLVYTIAYNRYTTKRLTLIYRLSLS
jgi:hypothetical protein